MTVFPSARPESLEPLESAEIEAGKVLRRHVERLATDIGPRNLQHGTLEQARAYIEDELRRLDYEPRAHAFDVDGVTAYNVDAQLPGRTPHRILLLGAHYDTCEDTPGADDNASGVAVLLELARLFRGESLDATVRFIAFANEEPPYFQTDLMGSKVYASHFAAEAKQDGLEVIGMISIESVGYFDLARGSQKYPPLFSLLYPDTGDFIGFVGNVASRGFLRRSLDAFRAGTSFPSEGLAAPGVIPGIGWSDHWAFWPHGIPAIMVTDTAPFRNPHYHERTDTPDRLDYRRMSRVLTGLTHVVRALANGDAKRDANKDWVRPQEG